MSARCGSIRYDAFPSEANRGHDEGLWAIALPLLLQTLLIVAVPLQAAVTTLIGHDRGPAHGSCRSLRSLSGILHDAAIRHLSTGSVEYARRLGGHSAQLRTLGHDTTPPARANPSTWCWRTNHRLIIPVPLSWGNRGHPFGSRAIAPVISHAHQIALKGTYRSDRIVYGLERYYLPEAERLDLENRIREAQAGTEEQPRFFVEVRIGPGSNAVPIALWLQGDRIEF
jgi:hypothetical protein